MAETKPNTKKQDQILEGLFSTERAKVSAALGEIAVKGNEKMVIPLLKTFVAWDHHSEISEEISKILLQLKTEKAIPELIAALDDPEFDAQRAFIISIFWNSGLFPVDDIDVLLKHALRGGFQVTLEALTVVENLETAPDSELIQETIFDIDDFIDQYPEAPHTELLKELKQVLNQFYNV